MNCSWGWEKIVFKRFVADICFSRNGQEKRRDFNGGNVRIVKN